MNYVLIWCDSLGVFAIHCSGFRSRTLTEAELRAEFDDDDVLNQWADFAMAHPNVRCEYDMLPS